MGAVAGQGEQAGDVGRLVDDDRLGRAAAPHGDHDDVAVLGEEPCDVAGDRGLPHPLAAADHGERGKLERREGHGLEAEVGADVRRARRERAAREAHPVAGGDDRLVGEVEDDLGVRGLEPLLERLVQRHAVVLIASQLLSPPERDGADDLVRKLRERGDHDLGVVLAVDQGEGARHRREVTSSSIRRVYFSNSSVSAANWMIRSWPPKGYLRQTLTWCPSISITL